MATTPTYLCCKLKSQMVQPGGLTETVDYFVTEASALPPPLPSLSSPTCQETQLTLPGSFASTGGLSEVVEVHSFDSAILFLVVQSKIFQMIFIYFYNSRQASALIYQEVNVVFENKKCDYKLQMRLDCKESQKTCFFLHRQFAGQLMKVEADKKLILLCI